MHKRRIAAGLAGIAVVAAAAARGSTRRFAVREGSMSPALNDGDWIITRRRRRTPERGDIIVFPDPVAPSDHLVKRVIGLPGEHIGIARGRVTINGALLADRWASGITLPEGTWDVPEGHVWLLGDNRAVSSSDSRTRGTVPIADIPWIVVTRYWPRWRAGFPS